MSADIASRFALEVSAGNHDRLHCPVSFHAGSAVPPGKTLKLTDVASGSPVPVGFCGCCCSDNPVVTLLLDELAAGQKRELLAEVIDAPSCCGGSGGEGVALNHVPGDRVDIAIGGQPFTSYVIREGIARPYCYPVLGPAGVQMTNLGPADHVHHRSMYIAQGEVNGQDNWSEMPGHARTVNKSVGILAQGAMGALHATADWVSAGGQKILEEQLCLTTYALPAGLRLLDWDIAWSACYGGVFFGDTKEAGTLSVRVNEQLEGSRGGLITNAYGGVTESETWGKRAPWCDYSGEVDGVQVGLAIFDHPDNLRYPTWWHVRDYGLFTANQWGLHDFTGDWSQRGDYALPKGGRLRFRFRVYIHEGSVTDAAVAARYHDWATPPTVALLV
jgi:hypothetical protein